MIEEVVRCDRAQPHLQVSRYRQMYRWNRLDMQISTTHGHVQVATWLQRILFSPGVLHAQAALEALRDHPAFEAAQDAAPERVHESPLATLATMLSDEVPLPL